MSRRTFVNLVFFNLVFLVMVWWAVNNIVTFDRLERPYTITGDFEQASGVLPNAEVTYLGVNYGRVSTVERIPGGVTITMKIDRGKHIPAESIARIFRKSAIGEPYIDFIPSADHPVGDDRIEPGDHIPMSRTTVPLEFSELLRSASALLSSIEPEAAGSLMHELSLALDGRSDALRRLTTSFDQITSTFVQRTEELDRLAENSTRLTSVFADHRLSLSRSLDNLRLLTQALRDADGDLHSLLDAGPDFLGVTADLVADQKRNLDCIFDDLGTVVRTLAGDQPLADLRTTIANGPLAFGYVANTIDQEADGPWIRVNLLVEVAGDPPPTYVPPRSLPTVPTVSPCTSTLSPHQAAPFSASGPAGSSSAGGAGTGSPGAGAGGMVTGADPAGSGGSSSPSTGARVSLVLGTLLLLAAVVTWNARHAVR